MPLDLEPGVSAGEKIPDEVYEKLLKEFCKEHEPKPAKHRKKLPKHLLRQNISRIQKDEEGDYEDST
ncbi:MAG TPA: hypothetical protein O0X27_05905 [Methanocorpusculum sp.]|nr:hypothetical protein [Methanocorpusculum sp.]